MGTHYIHGVMVDQEYVDKTLQYLSGLPVPVRKAMPNYDTKEKLDRFIAALKVIIIDELDRQAGYELLFSDPPGELGDNWNKTMIPGVDYAPAYFKKNVLIW